MLLWLLTIFTSWSSAYFMLRYSAILNIPALYVASICNSLLPPPFLFTNSLPTSAFGWCTLYTYSTTLVFLSIFLISSNLLLIIPKLYLNIGAASTSKCCNFILGIQLGFLNILVYTFNNPSFICWCCTHSLSSVPSYLHLLYITVEDRYEILWVNKFSFLEYSLCTLVKSKFHMDITEDSHYFHLILEFFLCFI